jgi:4-hydroxy-2-oxoheptanedioate aldolase
MKMRESRVLRKLRAGETVSCFKVNIADGQSTEIAAMSGFDCVWVDREHLAQDWSIYSAHVWATKSCDTDLLVRVPRGSYSDYVKPLELDATGILVPHVMGVEDAKKIIEMTRFYPVGRRAIDGGSADGRYTNLDFNEYLKQANNERFVIFQIEDIEALNELDKIAELDGFDMLFFGPGDFSQSIGAPGDWNNPLLLRAREEVAKIAKKHGKFAATTGSIDKLEEFKNMGYTFINVGADVVGMTTYCNTLVNKFTKSAIERESGIEAYK